MVSSTGFASLALLFSQAFLNTASALPGALPVRAQHEVRAPYDARVTPKPVPLPGRFNLRAPSSTHSNGTTVPTTKSSSVSSSSSGAAVPTVPFGVSTTVISGTTYSLTYVATTASKPTTIVESNAQTTTTATYSAGAPIWVIPILPPGFPLPPPPPPPVGPPPPPGGGGGGGGGGPPTGCEFGCEGDNNPTSQGSQTPTTTQNSQSTRSSTASSSSSSSSSSGLFCEVGCSICNLGRREAAPTATPNKPKREIGNLLQYASSTLQERNIPGEGNDVPAETYDDVEKSGNTLTVTLADGPVPGSAVARQGISSSQFTAFDEAEHNIFVKGLEGCTSVIVVSRKGAWASHFWERPSFTSGDAKFQSDVIGFLRSDLGGHAASFQMPLLPSGNAANGNNPQKYPAQVGDITTALNGIVPGVTVQTFVYQVQRSDSSLRSGPYGKAMILYSNKQDVDPDPQGLFDPWDPAHHAYQVWTQAQLIAHDDWIPCTGNSKRDGSCPISRSSSSSASSTASSTGSKTSSSTASPTSSKPVTSNSVSSKPSSSTVSSVSSKPTSSSVSSVSSSTTSPSTTSTTSTTTSSTPTPTVDPNRPTNLKCYGANTPNSLFSFDSGAATNPINTFCNSWIGDYTYQVDKAGLTSFYPIDGKAAYESKQLLQISGIVTDYNSAKADTDDQKAATIASCVKGLTNVLWYCDYGSGTKWGGVGLWNGQVLGIAGDTGSTTLPLGY